MKKTCRKLNNHAVTLVEVLAAIVIIGIIGAGILSIMNSSVKTTLKTSRKEYAASYARNVNEIWLWHKRYNPQKELNSESDFQTFHYSLARFIFNLNYADENTDDPEIYVCLKDERKEADGTVHPKTFFTVYFDSNWQQLKVPIIGDTRGNPDDVLESDVAFSIIISPGTVTSTADGTVGLSESIKIEVYTGFVDPSAEDYSSIKTQADRLIASY